MSATLNPSPLVLATPKSTTLTNQRQHQHQSKPISKDSPSVGYLNDCKTLNELRQLQCQLLKQGLNINPSYVAKVISTYAQMGTSESLNYAQKTFDLFKEDNETATLFMYNSLIRGYSCIGLGVEAILLYVELVSFGMLPDKYTLPFLLSACTKSSAYSEGLQVHGATIKMGFAGDLFVENSLIHFYGECGDIDDGRKVFDEMSERNVVSWTSLICAYARKDLAKEAVDLFFEMLEEGIRPNSGLRPDRVSMLSAISASAQLGDLPCAKRCHGYVLRNGLEGRDNICNSMIDMYMKCGEQELACLIFDRISNKGIVSWNSLIAGFVRNGDLESAWKLFGEMPESDLVSWNTILCALTQESMFEEAIEFFREMQSEGINADRITMVGVASGYSEMPAMFLILLMFYLMWMSKRKSTCLVTIVRNWPWLLD
ncbi:hypothetical protein Pint_24772 [Pistacia integerrima]|uniref:Uncharacterized protein n=1 Tax=Pistacia integerrima TaxID=434235 RepID=A0ACC0YEY6_9ROSI|nr:hypothetical protein Pint_24772 [Pistacia integerrima]